MKLIINDDNNCHDDVYDNYNDNDDYENYIHIMKIIITMMMKLIIVITIM